MYVIRGQIPSKSNCYKIVNVGGHAKLAKQKVLTEYEKNFYIQCPERGRMVKGYFKLKAKIYYSSNRPDLDNSLKILLDCLFLRHKNQEDCKGMRFTGYFHTNLPAV